ncbi:MAG TPA: hypothetical protein VFX15_07490 [Actinomycetes bacterium]|nr:hypothetical protein [Actinomycetes bacterium]
MIHPIPSARQKVVALTAALSLAAGLGVAALIVPSSAEPVGSPDALKRAVLGPNLIRNSGFGNGLSDWNHVRELKVTKGGVWNSGHAAALEARSGSEAELSDRRDTAPRSAEGRQYQASVFVKATKQSISGHFRLTEWKNDRAVARSGESFVAGTSRWSRVTFLATASADNNALVLSLSANGVGNGNVLKVDRVRLHPVKGVTTEPEPTEEPSPTPTATPTPSPTPSPTASSPTASSTPTSSPSPTPTQTSSNDDTLFGASVYEGSRTWTQAVADSNQAYGGMEVVRVFYPGLPSAWPGRAGDVGGPIVVSFKAPPSEILSGRHDTFLANWFRTAPKDREIWWTYWHEPEDDIANGHYTAQQFRDAYRRIASFADAAANPRLHNTLILMCWTVHPSSGRTFSDYFPGKAVVDTIGWDCYSKATSTTPYVSPENMYTRAITVTRDLGLDFGIAETGSLKAATDPDGTKRAEWLRSIGRFLESNDASFVCYFDSIVGGEFRLLDAPSQRAWRDVITTVGAHHPL